MKLNRIHQEVVRLIEPIPSKASELEKLSILNCSTIHIGKTITEILRSFRRNHPMNWDPWLLKDGDLYRLFYLQGVEGQTPWWIASHICGAVSTDLNHWEDLGILITPNPEQPLESGRISAGCALKENDTLYSV